MFWTRDGRNCESHEQYQGSITIQTPPTKHYQRSMRHERTNAVHYQHKSFCPEVPENTCNASQQADPTPRGSFVSLPQRVPEPPTFPSYPVTFCHRTHRHALPKPGESRHPASASLHLWDHGSGLRVSGLKHFISTFSSLPRRLTNVRGRGLGLDIDLEFGTYRYSMVPVSVWCLGTYTHPQIPLRIRCTARNLRTLTYCRKVHFHPLRRSPLQY